MSRKAVISILVVLVMVSAGVFVAAAQDDGETTFPYGPGHNHQHNGAEFAPGMMGMMGMMQGGSGFGPGMMMWGEGETMMSAVAEALGMEPEAFFTAMHEGQTLAEIAEAQGVALEDVQGVMIAQAAAHMAELVEAGTITQEQANEHLTWMQENIENMPMFSGGGFGPCMGDQTGFGMMGAGRGMMGRGGRGAMGFGRGM